MVRRSKTLPTPKPPILPSRPAGRNSINNSSPKQLAHVYVSRKPATSIRHTGFLDSTQRNAEASPLLKLPAEIRNKIYASVISGYLIHYQTKTTSENAGRTWTTRLVATVRAQSSPSIQASHAFALLFVCRQIFTDTRLFVYSHNVLSFSYRDVLHLFVRSHPQDVVAAVTSVQPSQSMYYGYWVIRQSTPVPLATIFPNLKKIYINKWWGPIWARRRRDASPKGIMEAIRLVELKDVEVVRTDSRPHWPRAVDLGMHSPRVGVIL